MDQTMGRRRHHGLVDAITSLLRRHQVPSLPPLSVLWSTTTPVAYYQGIFIRILMYIHVVDSYKVKTESLLPPKGCSKACFIMESSLANFQRSLWYLLHANRRFQASCATTNVKPPLYTYLVDVRRHSRAGGAALGLSLASSSSSMVSFRANQLLGRGLTFALPTWTERTGSAMNCPYLLKIIHRNGRPVQSFWRITRLVTNIFASNLHLGLSTCKAIDPYQKQRIDKNSPTVPFLRAGHIYTAWRIYVVTSYILVVP